MFTTFHPLKSKAVSLAATVCLAILFSISGSSFVQAQVATEKPKAAKAAMEKAAGSAKKAAGSAKKATGSAGESIKVGEKFPSIKLDDQNGKAFDLSEALKKGPVALVIFRSADW